MTSRLAAITDALGQKKQYSYYRDDRLSGITYVNAINPTPPVTFAYDQNFGLLTSMADGTGATAYAYVPVGQPGALRLMQENVPLPNAAISYQYDALGRLSSQVVNGTGESFSYDAIGRLASHADPLGAFSFSYLGQTAQPVQMASGSAAILWGYLPNSGDRRLASINNYGMRQYSLTTTPEALVTAIGGSTAWSFGYDNLNRLTGAGGGGFNYAYAADPAGNLVSFGFQASPNTATYNNLNEMASRNGVLLSYDADGDLVSDGVNSYAWDAENRLASVTYPGGGKTSFAYDGLGRRVAITTGTTTLDYLWYGTRLCQAINPNGVVARLYFAEGELLWPADTAIYYGRDQIGSTRDGYVSGGTIQAYDYDPYGNPIQTPNTGPLADLRYAGMFYEHNSGLYLTQHRAYSPALGRWLSRDPLRERSDPAKNLYRYVRGNPIANRDPLGLDLEPGAAPAGPPDPLAFGPLDPGSGCPSGGGDSGAPPPAILTGGDDAGPSDPSGVNVQTVADNQRENKQVRDIVVLLRLTPDQQQMLHREISGQGYNYQEILDIARGMFGK